MIMSEMPAEPALSGINGMLIVNGWKAYHDTVGEGREPLGFTLKELDLYRAIEMNPGSRQAFLDYFAARENYDRMPHISQGDGVIHRNPADLWLEQAQLATDLGGEIGLTIAQGAYPHDLERQLSAAELIQGIVNIAMAHADALGIGMHVKYQEKPPQYEHGPPAVWEARPAKDYPGFGATGPEPHAHPGQRGGDPSAAAREWVDWQYQDEGRSSGNPANSGEAPGQNAQPARDETISPGAAFTSPPDMGAPLSTVSSADGAVATDATPSGGVTSSSADEVIAAGSPNGGPPQSPPDPGVPAGDPDAGHPDAPSVGPGNYPDASPADQHLPETSHDPSAASYDPAYDPSAAASYDPSAVGHDGSGHDLSSYDPSRDAVSGHVPGHVGPGHDAVGHDGSGHDGSGHDGSGHDLSSYDPSRNAVSGHVPGHVGPGHDAVGHDGAGYDPGYDGAAMTRGMTGSAMTRGMTGRL